LDAEDAKPSKSHTSASTEGFAIVRKELEYTMPTLKLETTSCETLTGVESPVNSVRTAVKMPLTISSQLAGNMAVSRAAWVRKGMMTIWLRRAPSNW
jgi:hypothetical protein